MDRLKKTETQIKMENLYVYALLCAAGYNEFQNYRCVLEDLFTDDPNNEELLDLMGRAYKDAILHTLYLMNAHQVDQYAFGSCLMAALQPIYEAEDLYVFGKNMYKLWTNLPDHLKDTDPFIILSYADDCLDYGDEKQCRELYEKALYFYEDIPKGTMNKMVYTSMIDNEIIFHENKMLALYLERIKKYMPLFEEGGYSLKVGLMWKHFPKDAVILQREPFKNGYECYIYCTVQKDGNDVLVDGFDGEVDYYPLSAAWMISSIFRRFFKLNVELYNNMDDLDEELNDFLSILKRPL